MTTTGLRRDHDHPVRLLRPGQVPYRDALALQRRLVADRAAERGPDTLVLLEHPPVYTLGKRTDRSHVLFDEQARRERGIELVEVDRGGDVTYHGPGQLVGYPIVRLAGVRRVVDHVRALEEVLIRTLERLGVQGGRVADLTGVWVEGRKIAAIGVRVASGGITSHGFALNVAPRMSDFNGIVPCGISDRGVCSLQQLGVDVELSSVEDLVAEAFAEVFDATLDPAPPAPVEGLLDAPTR